MSNNQQGPLDYMTEDEAKEVHKMFIISMGFFTFIAVIAHWFMWAWRPWFPGTAPYKAGMAALESGAQFAQSVVTTLFA
jgi:light-harvesting complex 1 beta chain